MHPLDLFLVVITATVPIALLLYAVTRSIHHLATTISAHKSHHVTKIYMRAEDQVEVDEDPKEMRSLGIYNPQPEIRHGAD
jgi:hypothetical protein